MTIDWASDPFVRLYTRETEDDLLLSWEARAVWHELLKKFDKHGRLVTRRAARGIAALVRIPVEVVERVLPELLEDGRLEQVDEGFRAPNYQPANYTRRAPAARQLHHRAKVAIENDVSDENVMTDPAGESHDVTPSNAKSRTVTHIRIRSDQDQDHAQGRANARSAQGSSGSPSSRLSGSGARRTKIAPDWQPRDEERALASELGLDCAAETREFVAYWLGEGKPKENWDQTFRARLEKRGEFAKRRAGNSDKADSPREIDDM